MSDDLVVTTSSGCVRGAPGEHGPVFKGIPYAAPPVGPLRWRGPQPPAAWDGERDATSYGATAPQAGYAGPIGELLPNVVTPGDDHLSVNVWRPAAPGPHPVMVFLHGGAFLNGSGNVDGYDGSAFARDGVVLVTVNYRLGAEGFAHLDGATPNRGLLDQVAALEWVRDEIAAFGGDPTQVTVFGESAGAMSVGCLLAMPSARGLFRRAILQSGAAHNAVTPAKAGRSTRRVAKALGVEPTTAGLGAMTPDDVVRAVSAMRAASSGTRPPGPLRAVAGAGMPFQPVVDGEVLPRRPLEAIAAGSAADVELVVGVNAEEARLYLVPTGVIGRANARTVLAGAVLTSSTPRAAVRAVRDAGATHGDRFAAILTHWIFRAPARRLAAVHGNARVYEMTWRSPACGGELGACHALELGFVFDHLALPSWQPMTGGAAPQELADEMHGAWVALAKGDDPGWPVHTEAAPSVRTFGPPGAAWWDVPGLRWRGDR